MLTERVIRKAESDGRTRILWDATVGGTGSAGPPADALRDHVPTHEHQRTRPPRDRHHVVDPRAAAAIRAGQGRRDRPTAPPSAVFHHLARDTPTRLIARAPAKGG